MKIANNFVLGCAIEAMGEGFALTRKYGVDDLRVLRRDDRRPVQLLGLQGLRQDHGRRELLARSARWPRSGLKDANLALEAGYLASVPLPSGNVWRDRLIGAVAHGDGDKDWAVMALEQARASGLA